MGGNTREFRYAQLSDEDKAIVEANQSLGDRFPKANKRLIGYYDMKYGQTYCPSCAKHVEDIKNDPLIRPHYNTEFDSKGGDYLTCSAACGRTIVGKSDLGW